MNGAEYEPFALVVRVKHDGLGATKPHTFQLAQCRVCHTFTKLRTLFHLYHHSNSPLHFSRVKL